MLALAVAGVVLIVTFSAWIGIQILVRRVPAAKRIPYAQDKVERNGIG